MRSSYIYRTAVAVKLFRVQSEWVFLARLQDWSLHEVTGHFSPSLPLELLLYFRRTCAPVGEMWNVPSLSGYFKVRVCGVLMVIFLLFANSASAVVITAVETTLICVLEFICYVLSAFCFICKWATVTCKSASQHASLHRYLQVMKAVFKKIKCHRSV